jgi:signal transduction histidine kinase
MLMLEPYRNAVSGYQLYMEDYQARRFVAGELARCADGSQVPIERRVDLLSLPGQELYCHLIRDARERLEIENAKSRFLAAAAHELRSPLASIYGFAELLIQRQLELAQQREMLGIINQQAAHMTRLINELLDLARMEARGSRAFQMSEVSLADLVQEVVTSFMVPAGRSRAQVNIEPGLPEVYVDRDKIQQALCNLLSNAYKYSPRGGDVTLEVKLHGNLHVAIIVGDMGIGMSAEVMRHAFERFYRADQVMTFDGTGLGLSLVKEIIEHHGGEVILTSQPGGGTSVMVTLLIKEPS